VGVLSLGVVGTTLPTSATSARRNFEVVSESPEAEVTPYRDITVFRTAVLPTTDSSDWFTARSADGPTRWKYTGATLGTTSL
jgi:hypothetical protein